MSVYILEWGQANRKDRWLIECVCSSIEVATVAANSGREIGLAAFEFKPDRVFVSSDGRWSSNVVDGEHYRIREFKVETE